MAGAKRFLQPIRSILETSRSGILIVSTNGKITFVNESLEKHCGISFNALRGKPLEQLFPENRVDDLKEVTEGYTISKKFRMKMRHASGLQNNSVFVSRIIEQAKPEGFLLIIQPSEKVRGKGLGKDQNSILRVMDRRTNEACLITDILTGEDHFMSNSIRQLTGWDKEDFLKGGFGFGLSLIHPDDVSQIMQIYENEVDKRNREPYLHDHLPWQAEFRYRRSDGRYVRLSTETIVLDRNEQLHVRMIMTTFRPAEHLRASSNSLAGGLTEESIRLIDGKPYIDIGFLNKLRSQSLATSPADHPEQPDLTDRERQILRLLAEGLSTEKISKKLNISTHTVSTYRKKLLKKLDARNGAELVRKAQKLGILS